MRRRTESPDLNRYDSKSGRPKASNHEGRIEKVEYGQNRSRYSKSRSKIIDSSDDDIPKPTHITRHRSRNADFSDDDFEKYKNHSKQEQKPIKRPLRYMDDESDSDEFINHLVEGRQHQKHNTRSKKLQVEQNNSPITHRSKNIDSSSSPYNERISKKKVEIKHTQYKPSRFQISSDSDSDEVFRKLAEKYTRPKHRAIEEKEPVYHSVSKQINTSSSSDSDEIYFQKKSKKVNDRDAKDVKTKRPHGSKFTFDSYSDSDSDSPERYRKRSHKKSPTREQPKLKAFKNKYISSGTSSDNEEYILKSKRPIVPILSESSEDKKPKKANKHVKKSRSIISSSDSDEKYERSKDKPNKQYSIANKRSIQSILDETSDDSSDDELFQLTVPNILKDFEKASNTNQEKKKTTKDIFFEDAKKSPNRPKNTSQYEKASPSLKISGSISHQSPSRKSPYANRVRAPVPFDFGKPKNTQPNLKTKKKKDEFDDSDSIDELIKKSSAIATTSYQVKLSNEEKYLNDLSDSDDDDELIKRVNDHLTRSRLGRSMFDSDNENKNDEQPKPAKKENPVKCDPIVKQSSKPLSKPPEIPKPQKVKFSDDSEPSDFDDPPPPIFSSSPAVSSPTTPATDSISLTPQSTPQKPSDDESDGSIPSLNMPKPNTPEWTEWIKQQVASLEKDTDSNSNDEEVKPEAVVVSKREAEPIEAPKESVNRAPSDFFLPDDNDNDYDPHDSSFAADSEDEDDEEKHRSPIEEIKRSESEHQVNASLAASVVKELPKPRIAIDTISDVSDTSGDDLNSEELRALLNKHFSSDYDDEDEQ